MTDSNEITLIKIALTYVEGIWMLGLCLSIVLTGFTLELAARKHHPVLFHLLSIGILVGFLFLLIFGPPRLRRLLEQISTSSTELSLETLMLIVKELFLLGWLETLAVLLSISIWLTCLLNGFLS